jgi:serine/threonine-protein kinase
VAKLAGGDLTTPGQLLGTPAFMPPEQFTGAPIDGRTDLFSLGVILYRLATGEQPFSGETITAVSYKIVHTEPIPPSRLNPAIGSKLEAVLLKCLAKNPADRYQTGDALAADLHAIRAGKDPAVVMAASQHAAFQGRDPSETIDVRPASKPRPDEPPMPSWIVSAESPQAAAARQAVSPAAAPGAATPGPAAPPAARPAAPPPPEKPVPVAAAPPPPIVRSAPAKEPAPSVVTSFSTAKTLPEVKKKHRGFTTVVWLVLVGLAIVGSWYFRQLHIDPKTQQVDSDQSSSNGPIAGSPPAAAAPPTVTPPALDPAQSGRLRVDVSSFPSSIALTLEMDGKPFWSGSAASEPGGLSVPAGKHDFRMTTYAGNTLVTSNTVSGEVAAGRHLLVTAQVHPQPDPGAAILKPDARVTLTLKADPLAL